MADRHSRTSVRRFRTIAALLGMAVLVQGCSAPGFISRPMDNFKAYYNTFYNARKAYDRGVEGRSGQATTEPKVDRLQYVDIFAAPSDGRANEDLENAIRKSADVLRNHPDSKWVDDALLLIGKAYFHQRNLVGAEQKFAEVVDLGTGLENEARFWLARTLIAAGRLGEAEATIDEALAREGVERKWASMLHLARGELRVEEELWEAAAEELTLGLEDVPEAEVGARAQFLLGQVLETLERYPEAVRAYRDVGGYRPTYEWSYAAQYSAIRVEGLHVDASRALRTLRGMERDDKNFAHRAELMLLRGRIVTAVGRADDAWRIFDELLYDEAYVQLVAPLRGRIHYALGELYRDLDEDFVLAAAHFDTAAAQLRSQVGRAAGSARGNAGVTLQEPRWAPEAILDAEELKDAFGAYAKVYGNVALMDSLLALGALDDEAFEVRVMELRQQRAREMEEERRRMEALAVEQAFARGASDTATPAASGRGGRSGGRNNPGTAAGFLFHRDPVQAEEGRISFQQTWGDRPLVRNWRRIDAVSRMPEDELADEFSEGAPDREEESEEDALPEIDLTPIPRDSTSRAKMTDDLAAARYELGNTLFLGMARPDSAATWYRMVVDERKDDNLAQRALFALAEVQQALGDSVAAAGIFDRIVRDFPDTEFAERGRMRLGLPVEDVEVPDSMAVAEAAYEVPYGAWQRGAFREAADGMILVASAHDVEPVRPRALLAAGLVFIEWAERDTLDLEGPIPFSVPDSLFIGMGIITPPAAADSAAVDATAAEGPGVEDRSEPADSTGGEPVTDPRRRAADDRADAEVAPDDAPADAGTRRRRTIADRVTPDRADEAPADADVPGRTPPPGEGETLPDVSPDSTAARSDSLAAVPQPLAVAPADSVAAAADSLGTVQSDSVGVAVDSLAAGVPGTGAEVAEEVIDPDAWRRVTLDRLLGHVRDTYGSSPYGTRAKNVLAGLEAHRQELRALADSLRADSLARVAALDSVRAAEADSAVAAGALAPVPDSLAGAVGSGAARADAASVVPVDTAAAATDVSGVSGRAPVARADGMQATAGRDPARGVRPDSVSFVNPATWRAIETADLRPTDDRNGLYTGWLIVLEEIVAMDDVPLVHSRYTDLLSDRGRILVLTGDLDGSPVILLALGEFDSRREAETAASVAGFRIPRGAWFLHVLPNAG